MPSHVDPSPQASKAAGVAATGGTTLNCTAALREDGRCPPGCARAHQAAFSTDDCPRRQVQTGAEDVAALLGQQGLAVTVQPWAERIGYDPAVRRYALWVQMQPHSDEAADTLRVLAAEWERQDESQVQGAIYWGRSARGALFCGLRLEHARSLGAWASRLGAAEAAELVAQVRQRRPWLLTGCH